MDCDKCGQKIDPGDEHEHAGGYLCDDCYMDALSPAKACDPWAVYTATRLGHQELTPAQESILKLVGEKGAVTPDQLLNSLGLDKKSLERELATLRHLELTRGAKGPDGQILIRLFKDQD
jgi:hypothetical protein